MHNLEEQHMNVAISFIRYLKSATREGILFTKGINYESIDADWAVSIDDTRST